MNDGNFNMNMASFADTGQWRLIVSISLSGISAVFKNIVDLTAPPVLLFNIRWEATPATLLEKVEETIYNNPRMLEDFATHIVVYTDKSLWIPEELTEDDEFDENMFTCIYPVDSSEDIFADFGGKEVCLYTLAPGLNSFLRRTLPGCRVSSHLSVLKPVFENEELSRLNGRNSEEFSERVYVNMRDNSADIFAFSNSRFLSGSTFRWQDVNDIAYRIFLLSQVYGLDPMKVDLCILGSDRHCSLLSGVIAEYIPNINTLKWPRITEEYHIPLAAALVAGESLR